MNSPLEEINDDNVQHNKRNPFNKNRKTRMTTEHDRLLQQTKEKLDSKSPSFCAAKWLQVTMHLQNGMNHSCHHPKPHVVPVSEIKINSSALHNSEYKKQQRRMMLEGARPAECDYCWRVEDIPGNVYSDRIYKSSDIWARPYIDDIKSWQENINPTYVEVSFSNVCNFKCSYCAPHISSQWMEEIEKWGPYPTTTRYNNLDYLKQENMMPIPNRSHNDYVEAFWNWWPTMYRNLSHFRITGGEPLLSKDTFKILDYIIDNPNPNLDFSINSNLNPPSEIYSKFLEKIKIIVDEKKVKKFKMFTSAEAHGKQSEYIRFGMNYDRWLENIHRAYREIPSMDFTIMSTYNILSMPSYVKFLGDVLEIKRQYGSNDGSRNPLLLDIPYLRYPEHQSIFIMKPDMVGLIQEQVSFMTGNLQNKNSHSSANRGFYQYEADKLVRIYNLAKEIKHTKEITMNRKNFVAFVDEHDRRRGTDFTETFRELGEFYEFCKTL